MYCIKRGFQITTLHVDGKSMTLQVLIHYMPVVPQVNLASANEHVP